MPANIVELDRTAPGVPTVSGGSLSWQSAATRDPHGERCDRRSGRLHGGRHELPAPHLHEQRHHLVGRRHRELGRGISAEGTTLVQFRSVDAAGNVSAWTPATPDATDTVKLDRTAPSLPTISGGTGGSCTAGPVTLTASGSVDAASGFNHYESMVNTGSVVTGAERHGVGTRHMDGQVPVGGRARKRIGLGHQHRLYQLTESSRQLA